MWGKLHCIPSEFQYLSYSSFIAITVRASLLATIPSVTLQSVCSSNKFKLKCYNLVWISLKRTNCCHKYTTFRRCPSTLFRIVSESSSPQIFPLNSYSILLPTLLKYQTIYWTMISICFLIQEPGQSWSLPSFFFYFLVQGTVIYTPPNNPKNFFSGSSPCNKFGWLERVLVTWEVNDGWSLCSSTKLRIVLEKLEFPGLLCLDVKTIGGWTSRWWCRIASWVSVIILDFK